MDLNDVNVNANIYANNIINNAVNRPRKYAIALFIFKTLIFFT